MYVASVTAEDEHWCFVNHGWMVITCYRWISSRKSATPRLVFDIKSYQVVQHVFSIVTTKHINCVLVRHHSMFAASVKGQIQEWVCFQSPVYLREEKSFSLPCTHKFVTFWHSFPLMNGIHWCKIQIQSILNGRGGQSWGRRQSFYWHCWTGVVHRFCFYFLLFMKRFQCEAVSWMSSFKCSLFLPHNPTRNYIFSAEEIV